MTLHVRGVGGLNNDGGGLSEGGTGCVGREEKAMVVDGGVVDGWR